MQFDLETCARIEETLAKSLLRELDHAANRHPLFNLARRSSARARKVIVDADVRTNTPIVARYDVPSLAFGVDYRIDPSMTTLDAIIPRVDQYAVAAVRQYEKDLRSRLYRPHSGFLGLERLVPGTVGSNVIGGIDERLHPGWQSYAATNTYGVLDTLNLLDEVCATEDGEPDLTILGTRAYGDLVSSMDVQQRYWMISGSAKLLMLNGGGVYRDAQCSPDSGYVLTTPDFGFHAAVPRLMTEFTPAHTLLTRAGNAAFATVGSGHATIAGAFDVFAQTDFADALSDLAAGQPAVYIDSFLPWLVDLLERPMGISNSL